MAYEGRSKIGHWIFWYLWLWIQFGSGSDHNTDIYNFRKVMVNGFKIHKLILDTGTWSWEKKVPQKNSYSRKGLYFPQVFARQRKPTFSNPFTTHGSRFLSLSFKPLLNPSDCIFLTHVPIILYKSNFEAF